MKLVNILLILLRLSFHPSTCPHETEIHSKTKVSGTQLMVITVMVIMSVFSSSLHDDKLVSCRNGYFYPLRCDAPL